MRFSYQLAQKHVKTLSILYLEACQDTLIEYLKSSLFWNIPAFRGYNLLVKVFLITSLVTSGGGQLIQFPPLPPPAPQPMLLSGCSLQFLQRSSVSQLFTASGNNTSTSPRPRPRPPLTPPPSRCTDTSSLEQIETLSTLMCNKVEERKIIRTFAKYENFCRDYKHIICRLAETLNGLYNL